jgi:hypothetical protein
MSRRYPGGLITRTPVVPTTSAAPGVWTLDQAVGYIRAGTWPVPIPYWISTLGSANTKASGVAVDSNSNVYVAGYTTATVGYTLITKADSFGAIQWQRTLGVSTSTSLGNSIALDSSNNVYVVGYTNPISAPNAELLITKYNTSGTIQWQRTLGKSLLDAAYAVAVDSSGNVYVTGSTTEIVTGYILAIIAKYNTSGTIQWQRTLSDSNSCLGFGIAVDSSGNVYVGGTTSTPTGIIAKYDSSGTIQWQKITSTSNPYYQSIAVDISGNVYVAGYTGSAGLIGKYDSSGTLQWFRSLGLATMLCYGVAVDASSNVYVTGRTSGFSTSDIFIAKYDTSGTIQWQRTLATSNNDVGYGIAVDAVNSFYVVGTTNNIFINIKLPTNGALTGTYGSYTYSASSFTATTPSISSNTGGLIDAAGSLTDAAGALTAATSTLTSTVTTVP